MTEISNVKNGSQVVSLPTVNTQSPDRARNADEVSVASVDKSQVSTDTSVDNEKTLASGQDPLEKAARAIEEFVPEDGSNTRLRINKDDDTGRFVYQNVDNESGEVISQFPSETILEMIQNYRSLEGLVVDNKA